MSHKLHRGDLPAVAVLAHQLKGSAGTYGLAGIADAAHRLHQQASGEDIKAIETTLQELQTLCRQTLDDITLPSQRSS